MKLLPPIHHRRIISQLSKEAGEYKIVETDNSCNNVPSKFGCTDSRTDRNLEPDFVAAQISLERLSGTLGCSERFADDDEFGMEDIVVEVEPPTDHLQILLSSRGSDLPLLEQKGWDGLIKENAVCDPTVRRISQATAKFIPILHENKATNTKHAAHEDEPMVDGSIFEFKPHMQLEDEVENIDDDVDDDLLYHRDTQEGHEEELEEDFSRDDDDNEDDESVDKADARVTSKAYQRGYSPPEAYLPLPTPVSGQDVHEEPTALVWPKADSHNNEWRMEDKHLLVSNLQKYFEQQKSDLDSTRFAAFKIYHKLPVSHCGPPVIARLRRRLIRLIGHATLSHHRGKHEVIFQTVFLFDAVLTKYVSWVWSRVPADVCPDPLMIRSANSVPPMRPLSKASVPLDATLSLTGFFASQGSYTASPKQSLITPDCDDISRLSTTTSANSAHLPKVEPVTKEELRTIMITCLLLASKWNNSRYLPPALLCSPPVGRVSQSRVLELEVGILAAFNFNIPFKTSIMNHISLILGHHEETPYTVPKLRQLCFDLLLLILELSLGDYRSLQFSVQDLIHSSMWLTGSLINVAFVETTKPEFDLTSWRGPKTDCSLAVGFHIQNVEMEIKSAVAAVPKLKTLGRWANTREAPNVFGIPISTRMPSSLAPNACIISAEEHKTKTESLALEFLRGSTALAFDFLVAAVLKEGFTQPHRVWNPQPETQGLAFSLLHQHWLSLKAEFPFPEQHG